jgi:hypothetical protein
MKSFAIGTLFLAIGSTTALVCKQSGYDNSGHDSATLPAYTVDTNAKTPQLCSSLCKSDTKCQSFAIGKETCLLYSAPAENNITPDDTRREPTKSPYYFYDVSCEITASSPPLSHSSPICGVLGYDRGNPRSGPLGTLYTIDTLKRAGDECRAQPGCTAFAIVSNLVTHRGAGVLYYTSLKDNFDANPATFPDVGQDYHFYELGCPDV